ncbi:unnamed protein product [Rangifer tarandus platyrhynchus]|uniref:Uncharacterized protein n=1 Tax=Rangifer tarandus platyrhynchus TaxID=3082113 RepID=A0AC60A6K6_RANTA
MRTCGLTRAVPAPPHNASQESVSPRAGRLPDRQLRSRRGRLRRKAVAHQEGGGNGGPRFAQSWGPAWCKCSPPGPSRCEGGFRVLRWTVMPRCEVKHCSRCFREKVRG